MKRKAFTCWLFGHRWFLSNFQPNLKERSVRFWCFQCEKEWSVSYGGLTMSKNPKRNPN